MALSGHYDEPEGRPLLKKNAAACREGLVELKERSVTQVRIGHEYNVRKVLAHARIATSKNALRREKLSPSSPR